MSDVFDNRDDRRVVTDRDGNPIAAEPIENRTTTTRAGIDREEVIAREKEQFGGIKFGSAFFGWLAATGMGVLLTALVAAFGTALGFGAEAEEVVENADTVTIVGAVLLLVILFIAYYCGGYVAGRMARFSGAKQGFAVWLWAVVIAVVIAIVGAVAGDQFNILANVNTFPRIPMSEAELTTAGIITAVLVAVASLGGAILGGLAGMRYHRKVDRAGFAA